MGRLQVLKGVGAPSPKVAALEVEYRPRPDWNHLDSGENELEKINEVFHANCIEDEDFAAALEKLGDRMCDL